MILHKSRRRVSDLSKVFYSPSHPSIDYLDYEFDDDQRNPRFCDLFFSGEKNYPYFFLLESVSIIAEIILRLVPFQKQINFLTGLLFFPGFWNLRLPLKLMLMVVDMT